MRDPQTMVPIAIVGMACRLPQCDGLEEYWELLCHGKNAITPFPSHRLDRDLYFDPRKGIRGKTYTQIGGMIPDRPLRKELLGLPEPEYADWDECHLIFAEVAASAARDAQLSEEHRRQLGIYVGHSGGSRVAGDLVYGTMAEQTADLLGEAPALSDMPYADRKKLIDRLTARMRQGKPARREHGLPNVEASAAARLVAKILGASGPQMVIDAACASSLVALQLACMAIRSGDIKAAIVGGASYNKSDSLVLFSQAQSCSASGSRPFDAGADGLISSEGYVAIVIKSLPQALADGDRIWSVIRGMGISSDGRGKSLWAPRREGQYAAMQRAYSNGFAPSQIQYVEAHATSTQVGDATEMQALADMFGKIPKAIPVGSVKSNIGHTLETAGLASLLKCVLAMHHGVIPPTVNFESPSQSIPWRDLPFSIPTAPVVWEPHHNGTRCSAVNAFGIGGLNVHVILEHSAQFQADQSSSDFNHERPALQSWESLPNSEFKNTDSQSEKIAIVGRGVIVPGANGIAQFQQLIDDRRSYITDPPAKRWRRSIGIRPSLDRYEPFSVPSAKGGYLTDYAYDWRLHRVPPKQVERANPLQFMLLDAASQAMSEAGLQKQDSINNRVSVVVGTIFGGEFGHQLQLGLRIEEVRRDLHQTLVQSGFSNDQSDIIGESFEQKLFEVNPALHDETGSFTSSTLASRISKQFNLMGGALSIDAGDCSASAGLSAACNLLLTGTSDVVLCASGQRAMDLPSFENQFARGAIKPNSPNDSHANNSQSVPSASQSVPGEGVVSFVLKRLSDARRDGDKVYGVIEKITASALHTSRNPNPSLRNHDLQCDLVRKIGDLKGTQSLVTILEHMQRSTNGSSLDIEDSSDVGVVYRIRLQVGEAQVQADSSSVADSIPVSVITAKPASPLPASSVKPSIVSSLIPKIPQVRTTWLQGKSIEEIQHIAARMAREPSAYPSATECPDWKPSAEVRCAIVHDSSEQFEKKVELLCHAKPDSIHAIASSGIFLSERSQRHERSIALAFPGQGSQQGNGFAAWADSLEGSRKQLAAIEETLSVLRQPSLSEIAQRCEGGVAGREGIWNVQACMLAANAIMAAGVNEVGIRPGFVFGHSLGELSAMHFAGAWDIATAVTFVFHRANAVAEGGLAGGLLSVQASEKDVQKLLRTHASPITITHSNAPTQTVVGGPHSAIHSFQERLNEVGIQSLILAVPAPYHTPLLAGSQCLLEAHLRSVPLKVARLPVLSSVTNSFVSDPEEMRRNLLDQLVTPVCYQAMIEKGLREDVSILLEIGPGQVLSKLHRAIIADRRIATWSCDRASHPAVSMEELRAIQAIFSVTGDVPTIANDSLVAANSLRLSASSKVTPVAVWDATSNRRKNRREKASATSMGISDRKPQMTPIKPAVRSSASHDSISMPESAIKTAIHPATNSAATNSVAKPATSELEAFLRDFIVEHTGYPAEMIELDWDLEADLGIDSIKQAQLFGELREMFDFDPRQLMSQNVRTLRQLMEFLAGTGGKREWIEAAPASDQTPPNPFETHLDVPKDADNAHTQDSQARVASQAKHQHANMHHVQNQVAASRDELQRFMVDFVVEHTGYPVELVELDSEFEADLGLDSIKLAQLFGELRSHFGFEFGADRRKVLANCQTLNQLLDEFAPRAEIAINSELHSADLVDSLANPTSNGRRTAVQEKKSELQLELAVDRPLDGRSFEEGLRVGRLHRQHLLQRVELLNDLQLWSNVFDPETAPSDLNGETPFLNGVARSSGIHPLNLVNLESELVDLLDAEVVEAEWSDKNRARHLVPAQPACELPRIPDESQNDITHRYQLDLHPAPVRSDALKTPVWHGAAAILGENAAADAIERRLMESGVRCFRFNADLSPQELQQQLEECWLEQPILHLFLATAFDGNGATSLDPRHWEARGHAGIRSPYWLCQRWIQKVVSAEAMPDASLVGLSCLGGDFGFAERIEGAEGGAIAGLLKAIMIECWVNGYRAIPIKILDFDRHIPSEKIVDAVWHELANNSFDLETAWKNGNRYVVRANRVPIHAMKSPQNGSSNALSRNGSSHIVPITRGGNWIFTGGGRGITAAVARALAERYGIRLHLIGKSKLPSIPDAWRDLDDLGTRALKTEIMRQARDSGQNAITAWQDLEKILEVDATLRGFAKDGIEAWYYDCDVSNAEELERLVDSIRKAHGPIRGCVHGAGVGQDARFDRKRPEKVEQCIAAKYEGTLSLMRATHADPLEVFIGFGSISGRFGANGHTDYSLANDVLAKLIGWYRGVRPEVPATAFHWHAWGDIGMATKPETKLALEMIDMTFMPAAEGLKHLMREIEGGLPRSEVLITDDRYYRLFFPAETLVQEEHGTASIQKVARLAILSEEPSVETEGLLVDEVFLDPKRETFLKEHCLQNRPLLPIVVGLEMLVESAVKRCNAESWAKGRTGLLIDNLEALRGLRFFEDQPIRLEIVNRLVEAGVSDTTLKADFCARNGQLMERGRSYMHGVVHTSIRKQSSALPQLGWIAPDESKIHWQNARYPGLDQPFFVGPSFQVLKKTCLNNDRIWGRILAPILVELAGGHRPAEGWQVPSAVLDACLFATGVLAWNHVRPGISLPVGIKKLHLAAMPEVGEVCLLESRFCRQEGKFAWFDFSLWGRGQRLLLEASQYQICWLDSQ